MERLLVIGFCLLLAIVFSGFLIYLFVVLGCAGKTLVKAKAFLRFLRTFFCNFSFNSFLVEYWRILLLFGVILFAYFVWPTPYKELKPLGNWELPQRQNRFSGNCEIYQEGVWTKRTK